MGKDPTEDEKPDERGHKPTPSKKPRPDNGGAPPPRDKEDVDETLEETFPASDPPSWWSGEPGKS